MNLHQKLLLSLCHARYERAVKEATKQLMKEVEEVLLRMDDDTMGAGDDRTHSKGSVRDECSCGRVAVVRLVRDGRAGDVR